LALISKIRQVILLVTKLEAKKFSLVGNKKVKNMQSWKIILALVAVAALALTVIGLASAQTAAPNQTTGPNSGFWGWIGNCFRYWTNPPVTAGTQVQTPLVPPQTPSTTTPVAPAPNQGGYYPYGYGYGPCWARW
jgi:hypothetical protein